VAEREGDDPAFHERRQLVRHARLPPLSGAENLEAVALDAPLPDVVGGTVDTEDAARLRDADAAGEVDELQPVAEEHVILGHAAHSFPPTWWWKARMSRRNGPHPAMKGRVPSSQASVGGPPVGTTR
jgi:hypothetical protein